MNIEDITDEIIKKNLIEFAGFIEEKEGIKSDK